MHAPHTIPSCTKPPQNHLMHSFLLFLQLNASERRDIDIHICHFINYNHLLSNLTDDVLAKKKEKGTEFFTAYFQVSFRDSLSFSHYSKYLYVHDSNLICHQYLTPLLQLTKLENINPPTDTAGTCRGK